MTAHPRHIVRIEDLSFCFSGRQAKTTVFEEISFEIYPEEFVALVGPSGVGKSTLLRLIAGLIPPTSGNVTVETFARFDRRDFGFVFQEHRLMPWRKVQKNVEYGLENMVHQKSVREQRAREMLEIVGLADKADRWPHQLSGGQKQRVSLARALAVRPSLLLMDEPFSALDPSTRFSLQDELLEIRKHSNTAVVFVTHDMAEAAYLADRVIVLGGTPARISRQVNIEMPHPRSREEALQHLQQGEVANLIELFLEPGNQRKTK